MHTVTPHTAASAQPESNSVQWNRIRWYSLFWTPAKKKKKKPFWNKINHTKKENKMSVGTMILWKKKKEKLSSIQWEVWTASAEQQNAINVTYNIDVHRFHNINNQGVKCYWSSRVCVGLSVRACTQDGGECVFVAECVIEGMPRLSSACAGFPGCPCDVWDPSCLWG